MTNHCISMSALLRAALNIENWFILLSQDYNTSCFCAAVGLMRDKPPLLCFLLMRVDFTMAVMMLSRYSTCTVIMVTYWMLLGDGKRLGLFLLYQVTWSSGSRSPPFTSRMLHLPRMPPSWSWTAPHRCLGSWRR